MRRLLARFWRILTAPVRLFLRPFVAVRDFFAYEAPDTSTADVISRTLENPSVLLEHLDALRRHLLRALIALAITTALSFTFAPKILDLLARPAGGIAVTEGIEVTEGVSVFMRASLLSGFALAFPYLLFELFLFVNPGLKRRERRVFLTAMPFAFLLFMAGILFAYKIMLPVAVPFLLDFMGIPIKPRPASVINFTTAVMFWIGIAFEFPLIIYLLASFGIVSARTLARGWRLAIVLIAVIAAMVTPTIDPVNMALVMAPMTVLYFLSIFLAVIAGRRRSLNAARE